MASKNVVIVGVATWADEATGGPGDAHPEHPIVIPPPDYHPAHPIVIPDPPKPPQEGAGVPTHPIYFPPVPTHPIVLPPAGEKPPVDTGARPEHPIYYPPGIWGGANEPFPTPPIYIPEGQTGEIKWGYSPVYQSWMLVYLPGEGEASPKAGKK